MHLVRLTGVGSRYGILLAYTGGIGVFPGSPDNCSWDWRMSIADRAAGSQGLVDVQSRNA